MSSSAEYFLLLCDVLRRSAAKDSAALRGRLAALPDPWTGIVAQANLHFLTPALWCALEAKGLSDAVPEDARDFLADSFRLNRRRNEQIKSQCDHLVACLNAADITPLLLKGGVYLYEGRETALGMRMMADLDILLPPDRWDEAIERTFGLGYEIIDRHQDWTHDFHALGRPGDMASVEFHRDVGKQHSLLSIEDAFDEAVPLAAGDLRLLALAPTHRAMHNLFHGAVQDRAHDLRRVPLRSLHDLSLIMTARGSQIDWQVVSSAFSAQGYGAVLNNYVYLAERCLGLTLPLPAVDPTAPQRRFRQALFQMNHPLLKTSVDLWASLSLPFSRTTIDYIYRTATHPWRRQAARLQHLLKLVRMHNWRLLGQVAKVYRRMYKAS